MAAQLKSSALPEVVAVAEGKLPYATRSRRGQGKGSRSAWRLIELLCVCKFKIKSFFFTFFPFQSQPPFHADPFDLPPRPWAWHLIAPKRAHNISRYRFV